MSWMFPMPPINPRDPEYGRLMKGMLVGALAGTAIGGVVAFTAIAVADRHHEDHATSAEASSRPVPSAQPTHAELEPAPSEDLGDRIRSGEYAKPAAFILAAGLLGTGVYIRHKSRNNRHGYWDEACAEYEGRHDEVGYLDDDSMEEMQRKFKEIVQATWPDEVNL